MKKCLLVFLILMLGFNTIGVYGNDDAEDEIILSASELENAWGINVNGDLEMNTSIFIGAIGSPYFYVSLRGFIEEYGNEINWDPEDKIVTFDLNGSNYKIEYTDEKGDVLSMPYCFEMKYSKILNMDTNTYVGDDKPKIIAIYTMNNTTYISTPDFKDLIEDAGCDYKLDAPERIVYIKKYNYTSNYILSCVKEGMTYSNVTGILGKADHYENTEDGGCKISYRAGEENVEMIFSPYTDESDMNLISFYVTKPANKSQVFFANFKNFFI